MLRVTRKLRSGFTVIEIVIVVVILGILAAIVIPQFSAASSDLRKSNVATVQKLRSEIALYRVQHQNALPALLTDWTQLTRKTDVSGSTSPAKGVQSYGPYLHETPVNAVNGKSNVVDGNGSAAAGTMCGFIYDYAAGAGTGNIWATDTDGKTLIP